jgi:coenzyme F420-reducing hydrogenase delta subunit
MIDKFEPTINVFYCVNAFDQGVFSPHDLENTSFVKSVKIPCSSMIKDVFILKAFECGADGVVVIGCPSGKCKRIDGNIRVVKRVTWVQKLLDEIGLDGKRLVYTSSDEVETTLAILLKQLAELGPRFRSETCVSPTAA